MTGDRAARGWLLVAGLSTALAVAEVFAGAWWAVAVLGALALGCLAYGTRTRRRLLGAEAAEVSPTERRPVEKTHDTWASEVVPPPAQGLDVARQAAERWSLDRRQEQALAVFAESIAVDGFRHGADGARRIAALWVPQQAIDFVEEAVLRRGRGDAPGR